MSNELTTQTNGAIAPMVLVQQLMQRPDFTTDMLRDLLDMVKEQEHRAEMRLFKQAFSRCQSKVTKADADKPNPVFRSRYASLEAMFDAVWPAVMDEGFSWTVSALTKAPEGWDNSVLWFQGRLSMGIITDTVELPVSRAALQPESPRGNRAVMSPTQALGSLVTYMRKYLLGLMFGVVTAEDVKLDNDGNRDLPPDRDPDPRDAGPPKTNGGSPPKDPPPPVPPKRDPYDTWLDTMDIEAAKVTTATWDAFFTRPSILKADRELEGVQRERFQAIQAREKARLFPEIAGNGTDKTEEATP